MKTFVNPEVVELNINETANGILPGWREASIGWFGHHNSFAQHPGCPSTPTEPDPVEPGNDEEKDVVDDSSCN